MANRDPEFEAELRANEVNDGLVNYIGNSKLFAAYVDDKNGIMDELVNQVGDTRGSRAQHAALITSWKQHAASEARKKETSRGKRTCPDHSKKTCVSSQSMCKHKVAHVCNYILDNGEACMSPSHKRCEAHH